MSDSTADGERILEDVLGCKWSSAVLRRIDEGVSRPGALRRAIPGISTKVLNERLRKMTRYGLIERHAHAETVPRVEYRLTAFGRDVVRVLKELDRIRARHLDSAPRLDETG